MQEGLHAQCVDAWIDRRTGTLGAPEVAQLLGRAFAALWDRAHVTLGDMTLGSIFRRVIFNSTKRFPVLALLELEPAVESFRDLATGVRPMIERAELVKATHFLLTELLTVFGHLTAEILTPALHAELSKTGFTATNPVTPWQKPQTGQRVAARLGVLTDEVAVRRATPRARVLGDCGR